MIENKEDIFERLARDLKSKKAATSISALGEFSKNIATMIDAYEESKKIKEDIKDTQDAALKILKDEITKMRKENESLRAMIQGEISGKKLKELIIDQIGNIKMPAPPPPPPPRVIERIVEKTEKVDLGKIMDTIEDRMNKKNGEIVSNLKKEMMESLKAQMDGMEKKISDSPPMIVPIRNNKFSDFFQGGRFLLGDTVIEGRWGIRDDGDDLIFERYESGAWVEKGAFEA